MNYHCSSHLNECVVLRLSFTIYWTYKYIDSTIMHLCNFGPDVAYTKQKSRKTSCCRQEVLKTDYRKSLCFYKMGKEAVAVL